MIIKGLCCLLLAAPVAAHETFVAPASPARAGAPLTLHLSSTARFPTPQTAILPGRIVAMTALNGPTSQPIVAGKAAPTWLNLNVTPATPGVMRVAVALGPKAIALSPAKVAEYFAEIEASPAVRTAYAALPAPRQWSEFYTKYAKALVCIAPCADRAAAQLPVGHALEFVAADATMAKFQLLHAGKPLAGQPVQVVNAKGVVTRMATDADGKLLVAGAIARPLLLATTRLRVPVKPGAPFTSDFATLWLDEAN